MRLYVYAWCSNFADDGQDIDGLPTEGIEITCFHLVITLNFFFLFNVSSEVELELACISYSSSSKNALLHLHHD